MLSSAHRLFRRARPGVLLCGLLLTAGCGGVGTVKGTVTSKGKPVRVGDVVLIASDNTTHSVKVQDDGTYEIANVPTGVSKLGVISRDPAPANTGGGPGKRPTDKPGRDKSAGPTAEDMELKKKWFAIPDKYTSPNESGFTIKVVRGENALDLKLD